MPTYNYKCRDCEHCFSIEATVKEKTGGIKPVCPQCEGENVFQSFKSIGVINGKSGSSCSGDSCTGCSGC